MVNSRRDGNILRRLALRERYQNVGRRPELVQTFRETLNVKSFGALGDGVTDDSTAIQAAINAAATPNNTIYFPAGQYLIKTGLTITATFVIYLVFARGARLLAGANNLTLISIDTDTGSWMGPGVLGADLRGNGFTGVIGIQVADTFNVSIEDVAIFSTNIGIRATTVHAAQFTEGLYLRHVYIDRPTNTGIQFTAGTGDPGFAESTFQHVFVNLPGVTGIDVVESAAGGIRMGRSKWDNVMVWVGNNPGLGNTRQAYRFAGDTLGVLNASRLHLAVELSGEVGGPTGSYYPITLHSAANVASCRFVLSRVGTWTANVNNPGGVVIQIEEEPNIVQRWAGTAQNVLEIRDTTTTQHAGLRMNASNQFLMWSDAIFDFLQSDLATRQDVRFRTVDGRGGIKTNLRTLTAAATLAATDHSIIADATGGAFTITLPSAAANNGAGTMFQIKRINSGANNVTIATTGGQTIDGAATYVLAYRYQSVTVVSDGANWFAIGIAASLFEKSATFLNPTAANVIVWQAQEPCTVKNVRGYRVGGTGATINARRNGASNHLAADLSLTSADTWMDGGAVQNTAYVSGDKLEIMVVSVAGAPTQLAVQVEFTRP